MDYLHKYESPLGEITLASDGKYLIGLWFEGGRYFGEILHETAPERTQESGILPVFQEADRWLDIYFSGREPDFFPLLRVRGSDFRKDVCRIMMNIPYGCTRTYGEIAKQAASMSGRARMSARAVGGAVGHNPISLMIPCHRVLGANGKLTGYGGGLWRKEKLLKMEREMSKS